MCEVSGSVQSTISLTPLYPVSSAFYHPCSEHRTVSVFSIAGTPSLRVSTSPPSLASLPQPTLTQALSGQLLMTSTAVLWRYSIIFIVLYLTCFLHTPALFEDRWKERKIGVNCIYSNLFLQWMLVLFNKEGFCVGLQILFENYRMSHIIDY